MTRVAKPKQQVPTKSTVDVPCSMQRGHFYVIDYPEWPFHQVLGRIQQRFIRCDYIRDLKEDPIDEVYFNIQPLLRRTRYLVIGYDLIRKERFGFYTKVMRNVRTLTPADIDSFPEREEFAVLVGDSVSFRGSLMECKKWQSVNGYGTVVAMVQRHPGRCLVPKVLKTTENLGHSLEAGWF